MEYNLSVGVKYRILLIVVIVFAIGCQFGCAARPDLQTSQQSQETQETQKSNQKNKTGEVVIELLNSLLILSFIK
jgi:hypothetical protein